MSRLHGWMGAQKTNTLAQWGEKCPFMGCDLFVRLLPYRYQEDLEQIDGIVHNLVHVKPVKKIHRKGA